MHSIRFVTINLLKILLIYPEIEIVKMILQDTTCLKELYKNGIISNKQNKNEIFNLKITYDDRFVKSETNCGILHNSDVNKNFKKYSNLNKNKIFNMEVQEHFKQELKNEQAIQQDIYKMDVVYCEEERKDTIINIQVKEIFSYSNYLNNL